MVHVIIEILNAMSILEKSAVLLLLMVFSSSLLIAILELLKSPPPPPSHPLHPPHPPHPPQSQLPQLNKQTLDEKYAEKNNLLICRYCETINENSVEKCCACGKPLRKILGGKYVL